MQNVFEIQISVIFKKLHMHHYSMVSQEDMDIKWPCLASRQYLNQCWLIVNRVFDKTTKQCTGSWKAPLYWIRFTSSNRRIGIKRLTLEQSDHFTLNFPATLFSVIDCYAHTEASWWRHQMETFFALLVLCERNPPVSGHLPSQRPVTWSFDVYFDLRLNKWLIKQSRRRWFETPSRSLWRHCNDSTSLL